MSGYCFRDAAMKHFSHPEPGTIAAVKESTQLRGAVIFPGLVAKKPSITPRQDLLFNCYSLRETSQTLRLTGSVLLRDVKRFCQP